MNRRARCEESTTPLLAHMHNLHLACLLDCWPMRKAYTATRCDDAEARIEYVFNPRHRTRTLHFHSAKLASTSTRQAPIHPHTTTSTAHSTRNTTHITTATPATRYDRASTVYRFTSKVACRVSTDPHTTTLTTLQMHRGPNCPTGCQRRRANIMD